MDGHIYLIACCLFILVYKYTAIVKLKMLIILNIICQTKPAANSALLKNLSKMHNLKNSVLKSTKFPFFTQILYAYWISSSQGSSKNLWFTGVEQQQQIWADCTVACIA